MVRGRERETDRNLFQTENHLEAHVPLVSEDSLGFRDAIAAGAHYRGEISLYEKRDSGALDTLPDYCVVGDTELDWNLEA